MKIRLLTLLWLLFTLLIANGCRQYFNKGPYTCELRGDYFDGGSVDWEIQDHLGIKTQIIWCIYSPPDIYGNFFLHNFPQYSSSIKVKKNSLLEKELVKLLIDHKQLTPSELLKMNKKAKALFDNINKNP